MKWLDKITENLSRDVARNSSRRGFLGSIGTLIVGGTLLVAAVYWVAYLRVARFAGDGSDQGEG